MTDSLKFGPEWLRNLSSEGSSVSSGPKYQLAEHRYGREEMLALFDSGIKAPDQLLKLQGLYIEKTQAPMALFTMTDEETRQWNRGINSDAVLRLSGKAPSGPPVAIRGRGSSVDRGRGRTRGSGSYHYNRGLSYEEIPEGGKLDGGLERGYTRNIRTFDRTQGGGERWSERNGDPGDWNGSTSPRKEFIGRVSNSDNNWRRHRGGGGGAGDEEDGWRRSWGRSGSWRDEGDSGDPPSKSNTTGRSSNWGRGWTDEGLRRGGGTQEEVPEWATENPSESGGSFDASGAFHGGGYSDDENTDPGESVKERQSREGSDEPGGGTKQRNKSPAGHSWEGEEEESHTQPPPPSARQQQQRPNIIKSQSVGSFKNNDSDFDRIRLQHQNFVRSKTKEDRSESSVNCDSNNSFSNNKTILNNLSNHTNSVLNNSNSVRTEYNLNIVETENKITSGEPDLDTRANSDLKSSPSVVNTAAVLDVRESNAGIQKSNSGLDNTEMLKQQQQQVNRQGAEEDIERMAEVYKILDDEEKLNKEDLDRWFYTDPQGIVQGPFPSSEMLDWFLNGYFQLSLLLRRECDDRYVTLGDLIKFCNGNIPFSPNVQIPRQLVSMLQQQQQQQQVVVEQEQQQHVVQSVPVPTVPPTPMLTQTDLLQYQYQQLLQKQVLMNSSIPPTAKPVEIDKWNHVTPNEHLLMQQIALKQLQQQQQQQQQQLVVDPLTQLAHVNKPVVVGGMNSISPVANLLAQLQQGKIATPDDPVTHLIKQLGVNKQLTNPPRQQIAHSLHLKNLLANTSLGQQPPSLPIVPDNKASEEIQNLIRQLSTTLPPPQQQQQQQPTADMWGMAAGRPTNWAEAAQQQPQHQPPPNLPKSLWDMKTESQILAEQQQQQQQLQKQQQQQLLLVEEEAAAAAAAVAAAREKKKKKKQQEEMLQKAKEEEERVRLAEEQRIKEELLRREEERIKREKEEKKMAEELRKKQEEERQRKKEEKERKKEEERERKRLQAEEEERALQEELTRKKQLQDEELARRQEMQRRQADALRRLQEQQQKSKSAPWSQPPAQASVVSSASLAEIQKLQEREKKQQQQLKDQQQILQQITQHNDLQVQQREAEAKSNGFNLKWAEQQNKRLPTQVKSLAEIQAEEHSQLVKQWEKERQLQQQQQQQQQQPQQQQQQPKLQMTQRDVRNMASGVGVWNSTSQQLSWASNTPWTTTRFTPGGNSQGFWDQQETVSQAKSKIKPKQPQPTSPVKNKNSAANTNNTNSATTNSSKTSKSRTKKDEAAVLKIFKQQGGDDFTTWCTRSLQTIQADVDIPTFVGFLRDIESPYEVKDYVKMYLGEVKEAQEFAKQFLERRSRWKSMQKNMVEEDDMSAPAQAVNPGGQQQQQQQQQLQQLDFQEVKGKGKKSKKGKMLKMDSRCLGFSVTADPDRINIGDRDYIDSNM